MANMGSTGTVKISVSMMDAAVQAINDYEEAIKGLNQRLDEEVNGLVPTNFSGAAADGYVAFYNGQIVPNITEGLSNMLEALKSICESVKSQIPGDTNGVDDQLGQGNQGAGGQA